MFFFFWGEVCICFFAVDAFGCMCIGGEGVFEGRCICKRVYPGFITFSDFFPPKM